MKPNEKLGESEGLPIVFVVDDDLAVREALSGLVRSVGLRVRLSPRRRSSFARKFRPNLRVWCSMWVYPA